MKNWLLPSLSLFTLFSYNVVIISVMICLTIWITHIRINFPRLYKLTYTFVGCLLNHISDNFYCIWTNNLLGHMETVVQPTEKIL